MKARSEARLLELWSQDRSGSFRQLQEGSFVHQLCKDGRGEAAPPTSSLPDILVQRNFWANSMAKLRPGITKPNTEKPKLPDLRMTTNWTHRRALRSSVSLSVSQVGNRIPTFSPQIFIKQLLLPGAILGAAAENTQNPCLPAAHIPVVGKQKYQSFPRLCLVGTSNLHDGIAITLLFHVAPASTMSRAEQGSTSLW